MEQNDIEITNIGPSGTDQPKGLELIRYKLKYVDKTYWTVFIFLIAFAVLELFSASSTLAFKSGSLLAPVWHQVRFILVGVAICFGAQLLPSKYVRMGGYGLLALALLCLYLMIIPGSPFVSTINDAERWFKMFYRTLVLSVVIIFPILLGNLSTALLLAAVIFLMWFMARVPLKYLGGVLAIACVLMVSGYFIVEFGYVRAHRKLTGPFKRAITWVNRVDDFIADKSSDSFDEDDNYQRNHARLAVARGSASPLGVLPGNSVERNFLPLAYADYIFAIIVEETGLLGAFALIVLYVVILFRACYTSAKNTDYGSMLMVLGLALMLTCQAFVSMAVAVGLGPTTGQPLPMVSRGGTSVLVTSLYFAILMCVSREQNEMKEQIDQARNASFHDVPEVNFD